MKAGPYGGIFYGVSVSQAAGQVRYGVVGGASGVQRGYFV